MALALLDLGKLGMPRSRNICFPANSNVSLSRTTSVLECSECRRFGRTRESPTQLTVKTKMRLRSTRTMIAINDVPSDVDQKVVWKSENGVLTR